MLQRAVILLLGWLLAVPAVAQNDASGGGRWQFAIGSQVQYFDVNAVNPLYDLEFQPFIYPVSGRGYYDVWQSDDFYSVQASPGLNVGFSSTNFSSGPNILIETPTYMMARVGAGATQYNQSVLGFGVGAGLDFGYLLFNSQFSSGAGTPTVNGRLSMFSFAPGAVAELVANIGGAKYLLRFNMNLTDMRTDLLFDEPGTQETKFPVDISHWGIGLWFLL